MKKAFIPDQILQELGDVLTSTTGAEVFYKSRAIMCIKGGNHKLPFDVLLNAKDKFGDILKDYNILWIDDKTSENDGNDEKKCVIVFNGDHILTIWLTRRFGGATGGSNLWLVYNHPYYKSHYGYKGDHRPSASEIISFVEQEFDNF